MAQATIATTVTGLQGHPIATTAPVAGQAIVYNGTQWAPDSTTYLKTSGGTVTGALALNGGATVGGNLTQSSGSIATTGSISALPAAATIPAPPSTGVGVFGGQVGISSGPFAVFSFNSYRSGTGSQFTYQGSTFAASIGMDGNGGLDFDVYPSGTAGSSLPNTSYAAQAILNQNGVFSASGSLCSLGSSGGVFVVLASQNYATGIYTQGSSGPLQFGGFNPSTGVWASWFGGFAANGNLSIAGTLSQGSDATGKTNINPIAQGISLIRQLIPKSFAWASTPTVTQWGFIAQDVQSIIPEAVMEQTAGPATTLGLDVTAILAAVVYGLKQMDQRCSALETAANITPPVAQTS